MGCAKCGMPLTRIHHIEGYDPGNPWPIESLILLCDEHHKLADHSLKNPSFQDRISKAELYALKQRPFNHDKVHSSFRVLSNKELKVKMGGMTIVECPVILQIQGESMISARREDGQLLFSVKLYDREDKLMFQMVDNVWEASTDLLDLRYSEKQTNADVWIAVKMIGSEPYVDVKLIQGELYIIGKFCYKGHLFDSRADGIFEFDRRYTFAGSSASYCTVGISIS